MSNRVSGCLKFYIEEKVRKLKKNGLKVCIFILSFGVKTFFIEDNWNYNSSWFVQKWGLTDSCN